MAERRSEMKLSKPRRDLLDFLFEQGGEVKGKLISVPWRRLATQMASADLVRWEPGYPKSKRDRWTLRITEIGLQAIVSHYTGIPARKSDDRADYDDYDG